MPDVWRGHYKVASVSAAVWFGDFIRRLKQLNSLLQGDVKTIGRRKTDGEGEPIWLGGLFFPESFLTATRQAVAQSAGTSLESFSLTLEFSARERDEERQNQFLISGAAYLLLFLWDFSASASSKLPTFPFHFGLFLFCTPLCFTSVLPYLPAIRHVVQYVSPFLSLSRLSGPCFSLSFSPTHTLLLTSPGIQLEGAIVEGGQLVLSDQLRVSLPPLQLVWVDASSDGSKGERRHRQLLPVYLNETRSDILCEVEVPVLEGVPSHVWSQRGVALLVWEQLSSLETEEKK